MQETHDYVVNKINAVDGLDVEYFEIVDGNTLQDIKIGKTLIMSLGA